MSCPRTMINESTMAWYHGCWEIAGHYLFSRGGRSADSARALPFNQRGFWLDGGYAPIIFEGTVCYAMQGETIDDRRKLMNRGEEVDQGRFLVHRVCNDKYTLMAWWDRNQGDTRGACNSAYIVEGTPSVELLLEWWPKHFPIQAARLVKAGVKLIEVKL